MKNFTDIKIGDKFIHRSVADEKDLHTYVFEVVFVHEFKDKLHKQIVAKYLDGSFIFIVNGEEIEKEYIPYIEQEIKIYNVWYEEERGRIFIMKAGLNEHWFKSTGHKIVGKLTHYHNPIKDTHDLSLGLLEN